MLQNTPPFCSQTESYHFNYRAQEKLYTWLDKKTPAEKGWIRGLCISVWIASSSLTVVTRIASVFESFLSGGSFLINSAFKRDATLAKKGIHEIYIHTPKNVLRLLYTPIMFCLGTVCIMSEPKYFTMHFLINTRISLKHIKARTLGSKEHKKDIAGANFNAEFFRYQSKFMRLHGRGTFSLI